MRINSNIPALYAQNAYNATQSNLAKTIQKLSTGLRINSAADDAAGLGISEKMRAQTRGVAQAARNAQDGMSMIQTAEGALEEAQSMLHRMRELSVQAANDTLTSEDRSYVQIEIEQLKDGIDKIAKTTQFNKRKLLDGSADALLSSDSLDVLASVKGPLLSTDRFGQVSEAEGNYKINVTTLDAGRNQVLKSSVFMTAEDDSKIAERGTLLSDIKNFIDANGNSMLDSPQTLTISLEGGKSVSFTVNGSDTLDDFGEKLAEAAKQAAEKPVEGSPVQYVTDEIKRYVVFSDKNSALTASWLEEAAKRIEQFYGWDGEGNTLVIDFESDGWGGIGGTASPGHITLDPVDIGYAPWEASHIIAHELVHASMYAEGIGYDVMWMQEGLAEYIVSGNYLALAIAGDQSRVGDCIDQLFNGPYDTYPNPIGVWYGASYLAVRYFDQQSQAHGGTGIRGLLGELDKGSDMDAAIFRASKGYFADRSDLAAKVKADRTFLQGVAAEDRSVDTGAIGGYYATNGIGPKLPEGKVISQSELKENPLADNGWAYIDWPGTYWYEDEKTKETLATSESKAGTLQSVAGTLLLHSPIAGSAGKFTLSGDEKFLGALGFAEVQSARDTVYEMTVKDAHSGAVISSGRTFSGGTIVDALKNVDVKIEANFAVNVDGTGTMRMGYGSYKFIGQSGEFTVHIAATPTILQVGANEGEILNVSFGDIRSEALGIGKISLLSRESAASAITVLDNAISSVSSKRARLGAYQNRLEHSVANLTLSGTNLTDAESRIRDADMAKEMLNFTKLNILLQAGTSMMTQANQLPQAVLELMR